MTLAKMFDGDLWVLASDATQMAENAYKKGQADEREACAKLCDYEWNGDTDTYEYSIAVNDCAAAIRARSDV
jgi:hypothetical protein